MPDLPVDWVDNIGMQVTASWLNLVGQKANSVASVSGVNSITSSATPTVDAAVHRQLNITSLATAITGITVSNPYDGHRLTIRIKDNGTSQALALGSQFRGMGFWLPTATTPTRTIYLTCVYNGTDSVYDVVEAHNPAVVGFNGAGAGYTAAHGVTFSWSHTAAAGDFVIADIVTDRASSGPTVTYTPSGGSALPMTQVALVNLNGTNNSSGVLMRYVLPNAPAGAATIAVAQGDDTVWAVCNSTSHKNVSGLGATSTVRGGASAPSQSVTYTDGLIVQTLVAIDNSTTRTRTGGVGRWSGTGGYDLGSDKLSMDIATGTATTTFGISQTKRFWAGVSTILL